MEAWKCEPSGSPTKQTPLSSGSDSLTSKSSRPAPPSLRIDTKGVDPSNIVGRVLRKITRSPRHPTITLHFSDQSVFQIHVDGYNPHPSLQGIPKELEMDSSLDNILSTPEGTKSTTDLRLLITDCALVRLTDKAFEKKTREEKWDQNHLGLAFKFADDPTWHCVWATVVEYDEEAGGCTFRSYDDVYLQPLTPGPSSPRKSGFMGRSKFIRTSSGK